MCLSSFMTLMFGSLILLSPNMVSDGVLRIPVAIMLIIVGFASSLRYMRIGFEYESYYKKPMDL